MKKERNTKQKKWLMEYLKKHGDEHLTIQQIYEELKEKIGMTTIYRIIDGLAEKGYVTKIPMENKQGYCYRYNANETCQEHYHLICEKCNRLYHFESKEIAKVNEEARKTENFEIDNQRIVFYGICKECKIG